MPEQTAKVSGQAHPFVMTLDEKPTFGHIFSSLKVKVVLPPRFDLDEDEDDGGLLPAPWVTIERRCVLCQGLPIDLLLVNGSFKKCEGLYQ
jgi:hypothetical protein